MIFSGTNPAGVKHIELIYSGVKTQTRRPTARYVVGRSYAVQPRRCAPGDPRGRILILERWSEERDGYGGVPLGPGDAAEEGGYTPDTYEALYEALYPGWYERHAYAFGVVP